MSPFILVPFGVGTLAFFASLFLTLSQPRPAEVGHEASSSPLRRWDAALTWLMWGGWGCAMLMRFLDRNGFLSSLTG